MIERKYSASGICVILLLSVTLLPKSAQADSGRSDDDRPIRLHAIASDGPIGLIAGGALNRGALLINGYPASDVQMIWSGDMLQSRTDRSLPVSIDSVGEITLLKGAMVRLATKYNLLQNNSKRSIIIASLVCGSISISLKQGACAYLQAGGETFVSSEGAFFDASVRE